jgi:hypothetical protein
MIQGRIHYVAVVNKVMKIRVLQEAGNFFTT